jgi:hypothetical protein
VTFINTSGDCLDYSLASRVAGVVKDHRVNGPALGIKLWRRATQPQLVVIDQVFK